MALGAALQQNQSLRRLLLCGNHLGDAFTAVIDGVVASPSLEQVQLSKHVHEVQILKGQVPNDTVTLPTTSESSDEITSSL